MSKNTIFKQALRSENWDEAARLVIANPHLPLKIDARRQSFVSYAARDGRWAETEWLLDRGACLNAALSGWVEHGALAPSKTEELMFQRLTVLLENKLNPLTTVFFSELALSAIQACRADVLSLLLNNEFANETGDSWSPAWRKAIKKFDPIICEVLIAAKSESLNNKAFQSELGLQAIAGNNAEALHWLESHGLDVNQRSIKGKTLLGLAAAMGREKICGWLGEHGALIDIRDVEGRTALYEAVVYGHNECARELIRLGADPELRQGVKGQGDSPLRLASKANARDMRRILMAQLEQVSMLKALPPLPNQQRLLQRL